LLHPVKEVRQSCAITSLFTHAVTSKLTIFYRTSVNAKAGTPFLAGTPFALQTLKLQWRSGD
jgi:hypothetical protein